MRMDACHAAADAVARTALLLVVMVGLLAIFLQKETIPHSSVRRDEGLWSCMSLQKR